MQILIHQYSMNLARNKWQFYDLNKNKIKKNNQIKTKCFIKTMTF